MREGREMRERILYWSGYMRKVSSVRERRLQRSGYGDFLFYFICQSCFIFWLSKIILLCLYHLFIILISMWLWIRVYEGHDWFYLVLHFRPIWLDERFMNVIFTFIHFYVLFISYIGRNPEDMIDFLYWHWYGCKIFIQFILHVYIYFIHVYLLTDFFIYIPVYIN